MRYATPTPVAALSASNSPAYGWPVGTAQRSVPVMARPPMRTAPSVATYRTAQAPRKQASAKQAGTMRALLCFFAFWVVASFGFVMLFLERLGA